MDQSFQRLQELFARYRGGTATPAEHRELMEMIRDSANEEAFKQLIDREIEGPLRQEPMTPFPLSEAQSGNMLNNIFQTGQAANPRPPASTAPRHPAPVRPLWQSIGRVAAAILVLAITSRIIWQLVKPGQGKQQLQSTVQSAPSQKQDIPPGRKAAILTLADGRQLTLDSSNGTVSRQGNTAIINMGSTLSYKTAGPASGQPMYNTLATNTGNQYQLVLPDGSRVWLNAASSVRFPVQFGSRERSVEITGEAYFEIKADPSRPFFVRHKDMTVQVLGTHFNINAYADEASVNTTLLEGSVNIVRGSRQQKIQPGQQLRLEQGGAMQVVDNIRTEEVVAWTKEEFSFHNADIHQIMRQLARWYNIRINWEGGSIDEHFYANISRSVSLSEVLKALSMTGKVHFSTAGQTVTVKP